MAIFPLRGCMILVRTIYYKWGSLGVHQYQKDPKSVKKWLSYGYSKHLNKRDNHNKGETVSKVAFFQLT